MTLLITVFAAITSTLVWYIKDPKNELKTGILCFMYWGAAIMWFVDAVVEYCEIREKFFTPTPLEMLNDTYLGLSVVALGLVIWVVILLLKDPREVIKSALIDEK